jgi:hypothetical protein
VLRDSKICSKKKQHRVAEYKAKAYLDLKQLTKKYPTIIVANSTRDQRAATSLGHSTSKDVNIFSLEDYTDIKDFDELMDLAKKFPYVNKILLSAQENINAIKSANSTTLNGSTAQRSKSAVVHAHGHSHNLNIHRHSH